MYLNRKGFTLVELIVSISIVALLATIGISTYSNVQLNARNSKRKADLRELKAALEQYYADNNSYPTTGSLQFGTCANYQSKSDTGANGYIPDLAPKYIAKLPRDPKESKVGNPAKASCSDTGENCYVYISNGVDYKLFANCTPEGTLDPKDSFYDPSSYRTTSSWQVSSSDKSINW